MLPETQRVQAPTASAAPSIARWRTAENDGRVVVEYHIPLSHDPLSTLPEVKSEVSTMARNLAHAVVVTSRHVVITIEEGLAAEESDITRMLKSVLLYLQERLLVIHNRVVIEDKN